MNESSLVDAELTGIDHQKESNVLIMKACLSTGGTCQIIFEEVGWWELCSFGVKNILCSIDAYDDRSLTEVVILDQDIDEAYIRLVRQGHHELFVLSASVGLSGWIIAANMRVDLQPKSDSVAISDH